MSNFSINIISFYCIDLILFYKNKFDIDPF